MTDPDLVDIHVGHRLRDMRASKRLLMNALGQRVGVSYQQIQKYETGFNRISASALWRLSGVFGVGIGYFFAGLDEGSENEVSDAATTRIAAALDRIDPPVRHPICALIDVLAKRG